MNLREYTDADYQRVNELHSQSGFDYKLPSGLSGPSFVSHRIIEDDTGIGMACFLRRSAEVYLICDPSWRTPAWRNEALRQLHNVCASDARREDIVDVYACIPPQIVKKFHKRLEENRWSPDREGWIHYSRKVD